MRRSDRAPAAARRGAAGRGSGERGVALIEFALSLPILIFFVLMIVDLGLLVRDRLVIVNVSREGGSIASRAGDVDTSLVTMLRESARPVALGGADGRIVLTRVQAGTDAQHSSPTIATQLSGGGLAVPSTIRSGAGSLGLPASIYGHLVYQTANGAADIPDVTVVEIFYQRRPITPVPFMLHLVPNGTGWIVTSRAIF
jgi:hypothetical protein